jgi:CHRD domain/PEP-CTERM motif
VGRKPFYSLSWVDAVDRVAEDGVEMKLIRGLAMFLASAVLALPALAAPVVFHTDLSGATESPPNASAGTGSAVVTLDTASHTMTVHATFSGLTGLTTASHIHCCTAIAGVANAGVATEVPFFDSFPIGVSSGTYDHLFDLTLASSWNPAFITANGGTIASAEAAFAAGMAAGKAYLNIHSTFRPGGEIRGFLIPEPQTYALMLAGLTALGLSTRRRRSPL